MSRNNIKELDVCLKDVRESDEVLCMDGQWHRVIRTIKPFMPLGMIRLLVSDDQGNVGYVDCTGDHLWLTWLDDIPLGNTEAAILAQMIQSDDGDILVGGPKNAGLKLLDAFMVNPSECCCIEVEGDEELSHQFMILPHVVEDQAEAYHDELKREVGA